MQASKPVPKVINNGLTRRCTRPPTAPFLLSALPAVGELGVGLRRAAWLRAKVKAAFVLSAKLRGFLPSPARHVGSTRAAKFRSFCFACVLPNRACKYLCRKVSLRFSCRALSACRSCCVSCKYLQAAFSRFGCRQVSRVSFCEYSQRVTISIAQFFVLQVLAAHHFRTSALAQGTNRIPTRRCTRPPTAPFVVPPHCASGGG